MDRTTGAQSVPSLGSMSDTFPKGVGGGFCLSYDSRRADVGQNRLQNGEVGGLGAASERQLEPHDKQGLEGEIPWNIVENDAQSKAFEEVEETKHDPVCQPLNIILGCG